MTHVLFLPKWYPNEYDLYDGNFIENHAHAIKRIAEVSVIFVHSEEKANSKFRIEEKDKEGIFEIRVFYQKPQTGVSFLDKLLSFLRFRKAQKLAYRNLVQKKSQPNICHIHVLSRPALLALELKNKKNIPFLITEHWSGYLPSNGAYSGFLKKKFTRYVVSKASYIHTVSTQLKEAMINHGLNGNYTVIPNVVDDDLFHPVEVKNEKVEIIFVGNLLQRPKKILDIIQAMLVLKNSSLDFRLCIYGEGRDEREAKKLVEKLALEKHIEFRGTTNRAGIAKAMAESDFLILFSEFENQPCVIAEAQASGIPVILPDLPGIAERMKPELGLLISTGNRQELEAALIEMCGNYQAYSKKTIRDYGLNTFGEKAIAVQFEQLYQKVLAS